MTRRLKEQYRNNSIVVGGTGRLIRFNKEGVITNMSDLTQEDILPLESFFVPLEDEAVTTLPPTTTQAPTTTQPPTTQAPTTTTPPTTQAPTTTQAPVTTEAPTTTEAPEKEAPKTTRKPRKKKEEAE